ncbi:putative aspartic peptidase A1 family, aspartic peptidase domain superfamily, xylanase inhibitor [Helianthus annuus]|nr:putative aspartic peptidase A1 family, aspartic peptidase domain superfamily, xylanase inhibitor [Helianthus annuus]KAJ0881047.1 putative aspartic peptidase A1 family, aspartic peptidase domain superfamily, xylanase inhibitor [Helianthus annuus]
MFYLLQLLVVVLATISHKHEVIAAHFVPYTSVVAPVNKHTDAAKPLYSVQVMTDYVNMQFLHANFLIDIDAPFIWHDCIVQWNTRPGSCPPNKLCVSPASCEEFECQEVRASYSYKNPSCAPETNSSTLPGWGFCTCPVNVVNPMTGSCDQALLNFDVLTVTAIDERNEFNGHLGSYPFAACAPSSSIESFPANVSGAMALSSSRYAWPAFLYQPLSNILSLCLPSKPSAPGVMFFGEGPYYLLPQSNVDVRSYLSYTPLVKQQDSFGYFIRVNSIVIGKKSINVPATTITKLSTMDPYTTLRTDIYNGVVKRFSKVTKRLRPAKPVAPFSLCYSTSTTGLKVPDIDFILPDGKKWTVSTPNSVKQVTHEVACLAFVDGGATSEPAIVIGTFQFEDNFLEFNLENSTFGFSSSLLRKQTSCSSFNFTLMNSP